MDSLHAWLRPQEYLTVDDGPEPGSKVINPSRGAPTDLVVGWGDFQIHFEASGAGIQVPWESDRIVLQRLAFLELKATSGERSFLDLFAVIKSLRQLVALGLGASVRIQSIYGHGSQTKVRLPDGSEREIAVKIIAPQLPLGQASNQYHFFELFTTETLGESFGGAVSNWLDASKRLRPVYDLIFSPYERPAPALELRFLELIHALEAHHRYVRGGQFMAADAYRQSVYAPLVAAIPAEVEPDLREAITNRLKYGHQFSLRQRLRQILNGHPPERFMCGITDPRTFIADVVTLRNYLTHLDESDRRKALALLPRLGVYVQQLDGMLTILLLRDLGYNDEGVRSFASHPRFDRLRRLGYMLEQEDRTRRGASRQEEGAAPSGTPTADQADGTPLGVGGEASNAAAHDSGNALDPPTS